MRRLIRRFLMVATYKSLHNPKMNMRYYVLRVVSVLKPSEVVSLNPEESVAIISAVGSDGMVQTYPLDTSTKIAINDVILIESYQKFNNFIEYKIAKIIASEKGLPLLRQYNPGSVEDHV